MTRMTQDKYDQKVEALKTATREANEVLGEMKRTKRELEKLRKDIDAAVEKGVDDRIQSIIAERLATYHETIKSAMDDAVQHVLDEFTSLTDILMGRTKSDIRAGRPSVPDLIKSTARRARPGDVIFDQEGFGTLQRPDDLETGPRKLK